jgi:hypothetical protein
MKNAGALYERGKFESMSRAIFVICVVLLLLPVFSGAEVDSIAAKQKRVEAYAKEIIEMRSTRAKELIKPGVEITPETFMRVCGVVGKRVKEILEQEGVTIRHAAVKYRNPANRATPEEEELIKSFLSEEDGVLDEWEMIERGGESFFRYTAPIYVEKQCLACHGAKDKRLGYCGSF